MKDSNSIFTDKQLITSACWARSRGQAGTGTCQLWKHLDKRLISDLYPYPVFVVYTWVTLRSMFSSPTGPLRNLTALLVMTLFLIPSHSFQRGVRPVWRIRDLASPSLPCTRKVRLQGLYMMD